MSEAPAISTGDALLDRLRQRCRAAALAGERLLPEPALAAELGVSRALLREALARLEHEGLVRRRRGEATTLNAAAAAIDFPFDRQATFADQLRRHGRAVELDVLDVAWSRTEADDHLDLGVPAGTLLLTVRKRWRADGTVAMVADNVIPLPGVGDPAEVAEPTRSMFALVSELRGEAPEWELARPTARNADDVLAGQLEVEPGAAVLVLDLLGTSVSGVPLYRCYEHHVPGVVDFALVRTFFPV